MTSVVAEEPSRRRWPARARVGPVLGLLFLLGPVSDLSGSPAGVGVVLAAFVALYVVLLPPVAAIGRRGRWAIRAGIALLAALAGLTLVLGAPASFVLLFVYVVAAAGLLLPAPVAAAVIGVTAAGVGAGLLASGEPESAAASYALAVLSVGALMVAFARQTRANHELRAAREELARLAVSEERLRIARDLHDLLGHTLSVIALKSELATRLARSDPGRAEAEMDEVQRVTRQALTQVREAVRGYRRLALPEALDGARAVLGAAGIECRVESVPEELPEPVEDLLAWAVREAATNVVRHSGAGRCTIAFSGADGRVALQVDDDGAGAPDGDGAGLAGLAERARRLDGALEAGARPGGGFRLRLTVPA